MRRPKQYPDFRLERLLNALKRYCAKRRGQQQWVARYIDCSSSTVSDWLHNRKKPTGEQVLAILDLLYDRPVESRLRRRTRKPKPEPRNITPP